MPPKHRLTDPADFRRATKRGRRSGAGTLVAHVLVPGEASEQASARVGLAVSRAVGNAVARNRVKRQLRHAIREHWALVPERSLVVLRAKPAAAGASYADLAGDLRRCLSACAAPVSSISSGAA